MYAIQMLKNEAGLLMLVFNLPIIEIGHICD